MLRRHTVMEIIEKPSLVLIPCGELVKSLFASTQQAGLQKKVDEIHGLAAVIGKTNLSAINDHLTCVFLSMCGELLDAVIASEKANIGVRNKEIQLLEIARACERLEKQDVPIPDALRSEKTRLSAELTTMGTRLSELSEEEAYITDLARTLNQICKEKHGFSPVTDKPKKKPMREHGPRTSKNELQRCVIQALQTLGGRARGKKVLAEMAKLLEGKLTPGDLRWIESTKEYAWQNSTRWHYPTMKQMGILRADAPTGIWVINEGT